MTTNTPTNASDDADANRSRHVELSKCNDCESQTLHYTETGTCLVCCQESMTKNTNDAKAIEELEEAIEVLEDVKTDVDDSVRYQLGTVYANIKSAKGRLDP